MQFNVKELENSIIENRILLKWKWINSFKVFIRNYKASQHIRRKFLKNQL